MKQNKLHYADIFTISSVFNEKTILYSPKLEQQICCQLSFLLTPMPGSLSYFLIITGNNLYDFIIHCLANARLAVIYVVHLVFHTSVSDTFTLLSCAATHVTSYFLQNIINVSQKSGPREISASSVKLRPEII